MTSPQQGDSSSPRMRRCPICRKMFLRENSPAMPFCSPRCKTIDLGRWLGEDYTVPGNPLDDDPENGDFGEYSEGYDV